MKFLYTAILSSPLIFANRIFESDFLYFFLLIALVFTIFFVVPKLLAGHKFSLTFLIYICIFITWMYGVLIGLLLENNVTYVFRNFFGLAFYICGLPLLYFKPSFKDLLKLLLLVFLIQLIISLFLVQSFALSSYAFANFTSISDLRLVYSAGFLVAFPILALTISFFYDNVSFLRECPFLPKNKLFYFILFILSSFVIIIPNMSKGFIASYLILISFAVILIFHSMLFHQRFNSLSFAFALFFTIIFSILLFNFFDILLFSLSSDEESNSTRTEQFSYLLDEFTLLGSGLGATLKSGYMRDSFGYGFELTYLSLIHKLGFVSLFVFSSYLIPLFIASKNIFRRKLLVRSFVVLGCMSFLIPGWGNPILLSPVSIVLHLFAIYLITPSIRKF